jgi:putative tryptophan/tyrosine transport system substrate-binding protein
MRFSTAAFAALLLAGALTSPTGAQTTKRISVMIMSDTPQLVEVKDGLLKGLKDLGYEEGKNLKVDFKSAQANFGTAQQIARQFVGDHPDVIVPITTPVSQAVVAAAKDSDIPVVFSTVTDPLAAKIVAKDDKPGGNVTGVADPIPIQEMMDVVKEAVPNLKKLGLVYDPSLPNSISSVKQIKDVLGKMGIETVDSAAMGLNNVPAAGQALAGKVDAIFVPNDTTVYAVFESLVKVTQDAKIPLFSAERRSVQRGAIATIGLDFVQMGKVTARLVDKVFKGEKAGDIDVVDMTKEPGALALYINKEAAEKIGLKLPPDMLKRAAEVF